ncbi:hypothetical protein F4Y59_06605 [Candidatus Poribacteria bacterium]|nr:hypothetical protein [Candidatus Poribacteria bacterium]MYK20432.1 hypothetical protein [Candidatus Poribacteria bacterium]
MKLPTISIASHRVTRLIIGGNPYSGISHRSAAASQAMIDYYTTIQIIMDLRQAERNGINTVLARADRHIMRVLNEYWNAGGTIQWIAQTPKDTEYADLNEYLQIIAGYKPLAIYHHGGTTDKLYAEGRLDSLHNSLKYIRDLGCAVGLGTHDPQVLKYCYSEGYDVDFYVCALYNHTRHRELYLPNDRYAAFTAIQAIPMPVIAIKVLAAGRNEPREAFRLALENIKPTDAMAVGMYTQFQPDQIRQNALTVAELIRKTENESNCRTGSDGYPRSRRGIRCDGTR